MKAQSFEKRNRAAFEQWLPCIRGERPDTEFVRGEYRNGGTQDLWRAWQAGQFIPHLKPAKNRPSSEEVKAILQKACDRDWKDETLYQTAVIAANAIYWRDQLIEELREKVRCPATHGLQGEKQ